MSKEKTQKKIEEKIANTQKSHSRRPIFRLAGAFMLLLFCGAILYLTLGDAVRGSRGEVLTPENAEEIIKQMTTPENTADASFEAVMNYTWLFPAGDAVSSNAYVENSPNNRNAFYFTVALTGKSQTILYVSPNLKVGEALGSIKLDTELAAGSYDAVLTYCLLDDTGNVADTVQMTVEIVVEE